MKRYAIRSSGGDYPLLCGRGLVRRRGWLARQLPAGRSGVFLLSSPRVWRSCGRALTAALAPARPVRILFDDREAAKNLPTVERIARALVRAGADRGAVIVAAGGGVVGDVAGFAAASYMRGVLLVHVPTTLVAQVDSSIGGKTGVNLREGKNLVGAFYPPQLIVTDPEMLATLEDRQYRSGLYEVVKYAVIADPLLFDVLERTMPRILEREAGVLDWVVARCARIKAEIVGEDERESGLRQILNFGHTIGHALESASGYRGLLHGEAVGWGMLGAVEIARRLERVRPSDATRIARLVVSIGRLPRLTVRPPAVAARLASDKKVRRGRVHWVLPRRIGDMEISADVARGVVSDVLGRLLQLEREAREIARSAKVKPS
ncbi:MAG TPA: 3-dehydroquinate synthase [Candidatus Dormibacteraeota bacterium]|nr:3-dehydroquinate synthase [Candidatus Dormibacteraeota bacterium]